MNTCLPISFAYFKNFFKISNNKTYFEMKKNVADEL